MASIDSPILGSRTAAISNMVVRLMSQYTGRGPTKARTFINDDLVTVVLQDTLTKAERTLAAGGHRELVLRTRRAMHDAMHADLVAGLQEILGREVVALLGANHPDPDYAVEVFILAPAGANGSTPPVAL